MSVKNDNIIDFNSRFLSKKEFLRRLYDQYETSVRRFLYARSVNFDEVDDITQDVFVRLARMPDLMEKIDPDEDRCRSYLFSIAHNIVVDRERHKAIKRRHKESGKLGNPADVYEISPEIVISSQQDLKLLEKAVVELPEKWRTAFLLSRFKYLPQKEIAKKMSVTTRAVEKYISAAIKQLRKCLEYGAGANREQ
ncbi:sigma-70 family RNA polymerase sigma factor [Porticoccaceae bacterium LTM1]|nr:sigma-70 family RNA polymerase sigma factor [Porticoccaceae bacterium LTM1]